MIKNNKKKGKKQPLLESNANFSGGFSISGSLLANPFVTYLLWVLLVSSAAMSLSININADINVESDVNLNVDATVPVLIAE